MEGDPMFGDPGFPFEEGPMGDERRARGPSRAAGMCISRFLCWFVRLWRGREMGL